MDLILGPPRVGLQPPFVGQQHIYIILGFINKIHKVHAVQNIDSDICVCDAMIVLAVGSEMLLIIMLCVSTRVIDVSSVQCARVRLLGAADTRGQGTLQVDTYYYTTTTTRTQNI